MNAISAVNAIADDDSAGSGCCARPETPAFSSHVESLYDDVFGAERSRKASYLFRDGVSKVKELSWVAVEGNKLLGAIRYWPVVVGKSRRPALLLGPLAVAPDRAKRGIGAMLMIRTLNLAASIGHTMVLLVGDPAYYRRFGFVPATPQGLVMPGEARPDRLQLFPLQADALGKFSGTVDRAGAGPATVLPWPKRPATA